MTSKEYNDNSTALHTLQSINTKINEDELDILELFAQAQSLTIMEITNSINHTKIQRKYKNVYHLVQKLRSSKLIEEEVNVERTRRRHNERYYRLTDEGIYQLFLNLRYHGILADQMSVRKGKEPVSHFDNFIKYYENNAVFEKYLYPYFEKQTIYASDIYSLTKLFKFVHDCCKQVDLAKKIPSMIPQFSWNKVPGENDKELLTSIKEVFGIDNLDNARIEKTPDESTIRITASELSIVVKLKTGGGKAIATIDSDTEPRQYEYKILNYFSEPTAFSLKGNNNGIDSKTLVETPIYELVTDIGRGPAVVQKKSIQGLLAKDTKFMVVVEELHKNFNDGYNRLMHMRKIS